MAAFAVGAVDFTLSAINLMLEDELLPQEI
jgi:hypothetical protein